MTRDELLELAARPRVAAFLHVLRLCEGTAGENGYRTHFGGELFESFSSHPARAVTRRLGGQQLTSTAAGAYQFLLRTWNGLRDQYGFPDFSPPWQDAGAVALIVERRALQDLLDGRLEEAVSKCATIWASLPGSPYGQPVKTLEFVRLAYQRRLQALETVPADAGAALEASSTSELNPASFPADPQPISEAAPVTQEDTKMTIPMLPLITAVLPSIVRAIPELGRIFGSGSEVSQRNLAGAARVLEVVTEATRSVNAVDAAQKIAASPAAAAQARDAVQSIWFELVEAGGGGIDGARKADAAGQAGGWVPWRSGSFMVAVLLLPLIYLIVWSVAFMPDAGWDPAVRASIATGVVSLVLGGVCGYFFGSMTGKPKPA